MLLEPRSVTHVHHVHRRAHLDFANLTNQAASEDKVSKTQNTEDRYLRRFQMWSVMSCLTALTIRLHANTGIMLNASGDHMIHRSSSLSLSA